MTGLTAESHGITSEVDGIDLLSLLVQVERIARAAGALILDVYAQDFVVRGKADASPVTEADERAEALIISALQALPGAAAGWPIVAEESCARCPPDAAALRNGTFWLVDPLDGTREFVSRNGEFTVNIALIQQGAPVLGVVYVPVQDRLYAGVVGQGAWHHQGGTRSAVACRAAPDAGVTLACSRSHGDEAALQAWLSAHPEPPRVAGRIGAGSSLKFGLIAVGEADLYPRFGRTMEWDTGAGHAVLLAAGGSIVDLQGVPLGYGKTGFENPHFIAHGRQDGMRHAGQGGC